MESETSQATCDPARPTALRCKRTRRRAHREGQPRHGRTGACGAPPPPRARRPRGSPGWAARTRSRDSRRAPAGGSAPGPGPGPGGAAARPVGDAPTRLTRLHGRRGLLLYFSARGPTSRPVGINAIYANKTRRPVGSRREPRRPSRVGRLGAPKGGWAARDPAPAPRRHVAASAATAFRQGPAGGLVRTLHGPDRGGVPNLPAPSVEYRRYRLRAAADRRPRDVRVSTLGPGRAERGSGAVAVGADGGSCPTAPGQPSESARSGPPSAVVRLGGSKPSERRPVAVTVRAASPAERGASWVRRPDRHVGWPARWPARQWSHAA
jgi:hypothetical protein